MKMTFEKFVETLCNFKWYMIHWFQEVRIMLEKFVKALYEQANIHALAGRYLSREVNGKNPGQGYVRIALVASVDESREAISRIRKMLSA